MRTGIIDLGTNTFHLLIAEIGKNQTWTKVLQKRITVKLGKGGIGKNIISTESYKRGIRAIAAFREFLDEYNVQNVHTFGTAALRTASNGSKFLQEVEKSFNIKIKLIAGDDEARLIYLGVKQAVSLNKHPALIMDIGGGSIEFIIASDTNMKWRKSFKLGAALLLEKFNPSDPMSKRDVNIIKNYASEQLSELFVKCRQYKPSLLIGSAGSFETFSSMIRNRFPGSGSHYGKTEHNISIPNFQKLFEVLIKSNAEERRKMKGLSRMRVDMIVIAAILTKLVVDTVKPDHMKLSTFALKEGALWEVIHS